MFSIFSLESTSVSSIYTLKLFSNRPIYMKIGICHSGVNVAPPTLCVISDHSGITVTKFNDMIISTMANKFT